MRVEKIPAYEKEFDETGIDSDGKKHTLTERTVEIPGEGTFINYVETRPSSGDESYFYKNKFTKEQIVLHYTMGYVKGDVAELTKAGHHMSVPYLIGRSGTIYNLFPEEYWSYHLGEGAIGGNRTRSRVTIAIELSNIGPLKKIGDQLVTVYGDKDVYCDLKQTEYYDKNTFRGYDYFATFTNEQYESLILLLRYLTALYEIPREFLDEKDCVEASEIVSSFKGIVSHANYRCTGKTDFGPGFDWGRIKSGVKKVK